MMLFSKFKLLVVLTISIAILSVNCDEENIPSPGRNQFRRENVPGPGNNNFGSISPYPLDSSNGPPEPGHRNLEGTASIGPPEPGHRNLDGSISIGPPEPGHRNLGGTTSGGPPEPGHRDLGGTTSGGPPEPGNRDLGLSSPFSDINNGGNNDNRDTRQAPRDYSQPPEPGQSVLHRESDQYRTPDVYRRTDGLVSPNRDIYDTRRTDPIPPPDRRTDGLVSPTRDIYNTRRTDPIPPPDRRTDGIPSPYYNYNSPPDPGRTVLRPTRDEPNPIGPGQNTFRGPISPIRTDPILPPPIRTSDITNPHSPIHYVPDPGRNTFYDNRRYEWECNMLNDNCRLQNRVNFVQFNKGSYLSEPALVLDIAEAARTKHSLVRINPVKSYNAGRLTTVDYFRTNGNPYACLHFSFAWNGDSDRRMHILQRNKEDKCIYSTHSSSNDGNWNDLELQLDLSQGDSAFLIEFAFETPRNEFGDYRNAGKIAIRQFKINYGTCRNNQAFECDLPVR